MSQSFTPTDVASHNNPDKGMYIIVDSTVYDVTKFADEHPGGAKILKRVAGKDASKQFWKVCYSDPTLEGPVSCLCLAPRSCAGITGEGRV